ncbi:MAG: PadR family transcriptional regulator [Chloroflexi bacterium]|nr:PadR family transcriptional regulator [Chloroflexota bacterium]
MRGRPSGLLPLEHALLAVAVRFDAEGSPLFHGFLAAQLLEQAGFQPKLAATGTIYTNLDRLRRAGFLESRWEDVSLSEQAGRPRRRLYCITATGRSALAAAEKQVPPQVGGLAGVEL